jgi:hypothetical protein
MTFKLAREIAPHYVFGACVSLAMAYAAFTAWKADATVRIEKLEQRAVVQQNDHDALINLGADVRAIKETVDRIYTRLEKREALNGQ